MFEEYGQDVCSDHQRDRLDELRIDLQRRYRPKV
jgi:hypothetical protein